MPESSAGASGVITDTPASAPDGAAGSIAKGRRAAYDVLAASVVNDPRLKLDAKGLFWWLESRPDGWRVYVSHLETVGPDGATAVRSALEQLVAFGYVVRTRIRELGRFAGWHYRVADVLGGEQPVPLETAAVPKRTRRRKPAVCDGPEAPVEAPTSHSTITGKTVHGKTVRGFSATSHSEPQPLPTVPKVCVARGKRRRAVGTIRPSDGHTHGGSRTAKGGKAPRESEVLAEFLRLGGTATSAARFHAYNSARGWRLASGAPLADWSAFVPGWIAGDARASVRGGWAGAGPFGAPDGGEAGIGYGPTVSHAEAQTWHSANVGLGGKPFAETFARLDAASGVELAVGEVAPSGSHVWAFRNARDAALGSSRVRGRVRR